VSPAAVGRKKKKAGSTKRPRGVNYLSVSRSLRASYVFIVPLFAAYQAGIIKYPSARNGTETIYRQIFYRANWIGAIAFNLLVLALLFFAIHRTRNERRHLPGMYAWMFFEATLWAGALHVIAVLFPMAALSLSLDTLLGDLTAAVGAGIYEEGLFRFLLMGGLILVFNRGMGASTRFVVPLAIVLSALLFSYAHHADSGIGAEPWNAGRFALRTLLGALLGAIFWVRGLGIVVYTHAIYNVAVILPFYAS